MVRKLLKIVSVLFIIAVIVMLTIYYALFVAVSHTGVRYETLASAKIPEAMNDVPISPIWNTVFPSMNSGCATSSTRSTTTHRMS